jgi:hypothetical protein
MKARRSRLTYADRETIALLPPMTKTFCYVIAQVDHSFFQLSIFLEETEKKEQKNSDPS